MQHRTRSRSEGARDDCLSVPDLDSEDAGIQALSAATAALAGESLNLTALPDARQDRQGRHADLLVDRAGR
ncbi:hypothetical protein ACGF0K_21605 [Streptomyces sp. NPDC048156]|uniref:hypothetical protein n=1 Tax=Streptomyces sp. NPDC048156 TaxID=3365502 RepID=UPI0037103435